MNGTPPPDAAEAWRQLVAGIAASGDAVAELDGAIPDVDLAEGFRYILHVLGDQLDRTTMRDSSHPLFLPGVTPLRNLLFDNPDTDYDTALISSDRSYRVTGVRGDVTYLAFCVYAGGTRSGEPTRVTNLSDAEMTFAPDGTFEVVLSRTEHPGNWLRLDSDAHTIIARQYFLDRREQLPASYEIEAIGARQPDPVLDSGRFARVARDTSAFVGTATELAIRRVERIRRYPNQFIEIPGHGLYGTPDAGYVVCWYELGPGESLVIDVAPPRCRYWGVHLANRWGQSLDHRTRRTILNAHTAVVGSDGRVRITVGPEEVGGANWLDTAGHLQGFALFRWLLSEESVLPAARVVSTA